MRKEIKSENSSVIGYCCLNATGYKLFQKDMNDKGYHWQQTGPPIFRLLSACHSLQVQIYSCQTNHTTDI